MLSNFHRRTRRRCHAVATNRIHAPWAYPGPGNNSVRSTSENRVYPARDLGLLARFTRDPGKLSCKAPGVSAAYNGVLRTRGPWAYPKLGQGAGHTGIRVPSAGLWRSIGCLILLNIASGPRAGLPGPVLGRLSSARAVGDMILVLAHQLYGPNRPVKQPRIP